MACQFALQANVFASPIETDTVPNVDQEFIQSSDHHLKFTRMCFFVVERGNRRRYAEDLHSLKYRLCRHGLPFVPDRDTGCCVLLDPVQIEGVIRTIAERVERMVMQNSHREKIPFVATCEMILPRHGQPWQREAAMCSTDCSGFRDIPATEAAVGLIEKRKRNEGFDDDELKLEMGIEQFVNGCKRSRVC